MGRVLARNIYCVLPGSNFLLLDINSRRPQITPNMKTSPTILALLLSSSLTAQVFIGGQIGNKGVGVQAGYAINQIELTLAHKRPFQSTEIPIVTTLSAGYSIYLGLTLTPSIGLGSYSVKDFKAYNQDPTGRTAVEIKKGIKPFCSLEVGKDLGIGRIFLSANYIEHFYFGVGVKGFFK